MEITTRSAKFQHHMTGVFLVCLILGAISKFVYPWLPVVFVIVYFLVGSYATKAQRNSDRFADSLYYMGFLLTLVALLDATRADNASEQIIQSLGAGLSTTLAGLALRVLILQFRETVSDQEEEGKVALELEIRRMVDSFQELSRGVAGFHKEFVMQADLLGDGMRRATERIENSGQRLAELPQVVERAIYPAAEAMARKLGAVEISRDLFNQKLDAALQPLAASLSLVADEISRSGTVMKTRMEESAEGVAQEGREIALLLRGSTFELAALLEDVAKIPRDVKTSVGDAVNELKARIRSINFETINSRQESVLASLDAMAKVIEAVAGTAGDLGDALVSIGASAGRVEHLVSSTAEHSDRIGRTVAQLGDLAPLTTKLAAEFSALGTATNELRDVAQIAKEKLEGITGGVESVRQDVAEVRQSTAALLSLAATELKR
jgi:hypothetical protein